MMERMTEVEYNGMYADGMSNGRAVYFFDEYAENEESTMAEAYAQDEEVEVEVDIKALYGIDKAEYQRLVHNEDWDRLAFALYSAKNRCHELLKMAIRIKDRALINDHWTMLGLFTDRYEEANALTLEWAL